MSATPRMDAVRRGIAGGIPAWAKALDEEGCKLETELAAMQAERDAAQAQVLALRETATKLMVWIKTPGAAESRVLMTDRWEEREKILEKAQAALSSPPPPVVSLAEHEAVKTELLERLADRCHCVVEQAKRIDETWREKIAEIQAESLNRMAEAEKVLRYQHQQELNAAEQDAERLYLSLAEYSEPVRTASDGGDHWCLIRGSYDKAKAMVERIEQALAAHEAMKGGLSDIQPAV